MFGSLKTKQIRRLLCLVGVAAISAGGMVAGWAVLTPVSPQETPRPVLSVTRQAEEEAPSPVLSVADFQKYWSKRLRQSLEPPPPPPPPVAKVTVAAPVQAPDPVQLIGVFYSVDGESYAIFSTPKIPEILCHVGQKVGGENGPNVVSIGVDHVYLDYAGQPPKRLDFPKPKL